MYVIMGGTGHVGSAVASELLRRREPVAIVTHSAQHAKDWGNKGAEIIEADVGNVSSLREAFRKGRRAFLLNPPADVKLDTDAVERRSVANIVAALEGSGLEKVVVESTGCAQPGDHLGDLNVLWELEEGLRRQSIPAAINRAGYYMSNWDELVDLVRNTGKLPTLFPEDIQIPMVAPRDLGKAAAERLLSPVKDCGIRYIEGPRRYSPKAVALAFSKVLGRPVALDIAPREKWQDAFQKLGFSKSAAYSYARMTAASVDSKFDLSDDPWRGTITLEEYLAEIIARSA